MDFENADNTQLSESNAKNSTKSQSSLGLKCRKKKFKAPTLKKRPKMELMIEHSKNEEEISTTFYDEENALQTSKAIKGENGCKVEEFSIANNEEDMMVEEGKKTEENNLYTISENVSTSLDNIFFPDDVISDSRSSMKNISEQGLILTDQNELNECCLSQDKTDTNKLLENKILSTVPPTRKETDNGKTQPLSNKEYTSSSDSETTDKVKNIIFANNSTDKTNINTENKNNLTAENENYLTKIKGEKVSENITNTTVVNNINSNNTHLQIKDKPTHSGTNLDQLHVDIEKADEIINLLALSKNMNETDKGNDELKDTFNQNVCISEDKIKQKDIFDKISLGEDSFPLKENCNADNNSRDKTLKNGKKNELGNKIIERNNNITRFDLAVVNPNHSLPSADDVSDVILNSKADLDQDETESNTCQSNSVENNLNILETDTEKGSDKFIIAQKQAESEEANSLTVSVKSNIKSENILNIEKKNSERDLESGVKKLTLHYTNALDYWKEIFNENMENYDYSHTEELSDSRHSKIREKLKDVLNDQEEVNSKNWDHSEIIKTANENEKLKEGDYKLQNLPNPNCNEDNSIKENARKLMYDLYSVKSINNEKLLIKENEIAVKYDLIDKECEIKQRNDLQQEKISILNNNLTVLQSENNASLQNDELNISKKQMTVEKTNIKVTEYMQEMPILEPVTDILKSKQWKNFDDNETSITECKMQNNESEIKQRNDLQQENIILNNNLTVLQSENNASLQNDKLNISKKQMIVEKTNIKVNEYMQEMPILEPVTNIFKSKQWENLDDNETSITECKMPNNESDAISKESNIPDLDPDDSFDMDDDFNLTASQLNMIEANEKQELKESSCTKRNSSQQTESCSNTHFSPDSVTVEIMDQLCYIRETIVSIKELLETVLKEKDLKK